MDSAFLDNVPEGVKYLWDNGYSYKFLYKNLYISLCNQTERIVGQVYLIPDELEFTELDAVDVLGEWEMKNFRECQKLYSQGGFKLKSIRTMSSMSSILDDVVKISDSDNSELVKRVHTNLDNWADEYYGDQTKIGCVLFFAIGLLCLLV